MHCIEEDKQGIKLTSNEAINKLAAMFPQRITTDIHLPAQEPNDTKYTHVTTLQVKESLTEMQRSGGISQINAKS